jgi:hypothetical protein
MACDSMTEMRPHEDANQAAFRVVQQATDEREERSDEADDRCKHEWIGKRCKLRAGHLETHQFDL